MSWAEVLKINSDTSTPLNEFIESKMRYISSENVISVIDTDILITTTEKNIFQKDMKHSGVLSLQISKPTVRAYIYIYKNNNKILTITAESNAFYTKPFEFEKNDNIRIAVRSVSGSGYISHANILGMVAFGDF